MGILLGILIVLFISVTIWWVGDGCDSDYCMFPLGSLSVLIFTIFVIQMNMGATAANEVRINTESTYNRLIQVIDSRIEIDANLLKEIYDYNAMIETNQARQDNFIYWGTMPKIYDEFELIDLSKIAKSVSDTDSSVRIELD